MATRKCPYCGKIGDARTSVCHFCKGRLTGSPESESRQDHVLQLPMVYYDWGWVLLLIFLIALVVTRIKGGLEVTSALLLFIVGWRFALLDKYIYNFQRKIGALKAFPWFYWLLGTLIFITDGKILQDGITATDVLVIISGIGSIVCGFIVSWQLIKFKYDIAGGIKALGDFLFISNSISFIVLLLLLVLHLVNEDITGFDKIVLYSYIFLSIGTSHFIMNVFYKARCYNNNEYPRTIFYNE